MRITAIACLLALQMASSSELGAFPVVSTEQYDGPFNGGMGVSTRYGGTNYIIGRSNRPTEIMTSTRTLYGRKVLFTTYCYGRVPDIESRVRMTVDGKPLYENTVKLVDGTHTYLPLSPVSGGEVDTSVELRVLSDVSPQWDCTMDVGVAGEHTIRIEPHRLLDATVIIPQTVNLTTTDGTWGTSVPVKGVLLNGSVITISAVGEPGNEIYLRERGDLKPFPAHHTVVDTGTRTGAVSYTFNADLWGKVRNNGDTSYLVTITVSPS